MLRRIAGITGISLWAGLIAIAAVTGLQAKANGEEFFENLPDGWKIEESFVAPMDQTAAISHKLGGGISKLTNTILSIEGQRLQVNVIYCPTKKEADKIYRAVLEAHNGLAAAVVRDGNRVVEFAKSDDVELMNQARQALELPQADRAVENVTKSDINIKVAQLNIKTATLNDVIQIFGEPTEYRWAEETFQKNNLPDRYLVWYPNRFHIFIANNRIVELRHHEPGYVFRRKFQVGSSLNEVIKAIGRPSRIVAGQPNKHREGVLYKDIDGKKGDCYYGRKKKGVRCFFEDYKVTALYVTCNDLSGRKSSRSTAKAKSVTAQQQTTVETMARDFVNLLVKEDYAEAVKNFDETMKKVSPPDKLQEIWESAMAQFGPLKKQLGTRMESIMLYKAVFVTCQFEKAVLDVQVTFNQEKQIAGLHFVPSQEPASN